MNASSVPWLLQSIQSMNHEMEIMLFITRLIGTLPHQSYHEDSTNKKILHAIC